MALEPSIILAAKPPEFASPMQTVGGLMQMRDMASTIALRNAQVETQRQEAADIEAQAQQRTRDLQSWNQMKDLMRDPDVQQKLGAGDFSPIWNAGVSPNIADQAIKNLQGMASTAQTLAKGKAEFYSGGRALLASGLAGLHPSDDAAAAQQYNGLRQTLASDHPELAQQLPVLSAGPNFRDQIKDLAATNGVARSILEAQAKLESEQAGTAEKKAQAGKAEADTAGVKRTQALQDLSAVDPQNPASWAGWARKHPEFTPPAAYDQDWVQRQVRSGVTPEKQPEYDLTSMKAKLGVLGNSDTDMFMARYAQSLGKTAMQLSFPEYAAGIQKYAEIHADPVMRNLAIQQRTLAETMARMQMSQMPTDQDYQTLAKAVIDKTIAPAQFQELRAGRMGGIGVKVFSLIKAMDPSFDMQRSDAEFRAMQKTEDDFTSGKEAGLVRSNNNAIEHLALLDQARKALANGDLPSLQAIGNWIGAQAGGSAPTMFDHIAARVGDEVTKAFIPGGGGEAERKAAGAGSYASKMGDAQIAANIRADIQLMDSQQRHLIDQYKRGTYGKGGQQLFTPEAMTARDRLLGGAPAAGQAPALPSTLTSADKGKVYTNRQGQRIRITDVNPQDPTQFKFDLVNH